MSDPRPQPPARALPLGARALLGAYGLAWRAALPGLRRNSRLKEGWDERMLRHGPPPRADLWLQAASGGEAYLAWELARRLPDALSDALSGGLPGGPPRDRPVRVLATTFTAQGMGVLARAAEELAGRVELLPAWFPFDMPGNMAAALSAVAPRAVVLLETELWPGLLAACRRAGVPALAVNARMTPKSLKGYLRLPGFWRAFAPGRVLAVSEDDARRFAALFPTARTQIMANIKFDRLDFTPGPASPALAGLLPEGAPFIVLGSVRRQEEEPVLSLVQGLLSRLPGAVVGLFPRHMERLDAWEGLLSRAGVPHSRRSAGAARPGSALLWDAFGELGAAFALARTCFIGGSLAELGGQNFLEPLAHGVVPVIGPSWSNFAWVGEELFDCGLARREEDAAAVLDALCQLAQSPPDRQDVRARAEAYARSRRGGADAACQAVAECLNCG